MNRAVTPTFIDVEDEEIHDATHAALKKLHNSRIRKKEKEQQEILDKQKSEIDAPTLEMRQLDLFIADLLDYNLKDDMASMEAPLFSLSTKADMETWRWESVDKKKWVEVMPSSKGRATIHDKDLLIYLISQLVAAMNLAERNNSKMPGRRISFTAYDFLLATNRDPGGTSYVNMEDTLDRLAGTKIKTNINMGNKDSRSSFGLIEKHDYIIEKMPDGKSKMTSIVVTLSDWLYSALELKNILTINPYYFNLRKPLEKRLYQIARKHVGTQPEFEFTEEDLLQKCGSRASIREFRRMVKTIIADDNIPDYRFQQFKNSFSGANKIKMYLKDPKKLALAYAGKLKEKKKIITKYR